MRELLLAPDEDESLLKKLGEVVAERVEEGHGEAVFDLGFENNGDTLGLSKAEWGLAYDRLARAAKLAHADCQTLLTRNVGDEAAVETKSKEKDCTGKIMVRRVPATVENVIETRIAVVGNGMSQDDRRHEPRTNALQSMPGKALCWESSSRGTSTTGVAELA